MKKLIYVSVFATFINIAYASDKEIITDVFDTLSNTSKNIPQTNTFPSHNDKQLDSPVASISFSGGNYFSCMYELGVLQHLQENFDLSQTHFLGDSSGCWGALAGTLELPAEKFFEKALLNSAKEKHQMPFLGFSHWREILQRNFIALAKEVNEGMVSEKSMHTNVDGRLSISVTHADWGGKWQIPFIKKEIPWIFRNELVSEYSSDDDLLETVFTSCHIPFLLSNSFFSKWRGNRCLDGGITNKNPKLNEKTCLVHPLLWRSSSFWLEHGCITLPTEADARNSYKWGYEDAQNNYSYWVSHGITPKSSTIKELSFLPSQDLPTAKPKQTRISAILERINGYKKEVQVTYFLAKNILGAQINNCLQRLWYGNKNKDSLLPPKLVHQQKTL